MTLEENRAAIAAKQQWIDSLPYKSTIPYPYCCVCFEKLTEHNILEKEDGLWDVCLDCKDK